MNEATTATRAQVRDPICGTDVDPATAAHRVEHHGTTLYFCGTRRVETFQRAPEAALARASNPIQKGKGGGDQPATKAAGNYICSMCPGVESEGPASCPKCSMALEHGVPTYSARQVRYTCPMHPRDRAGGASNQIGRDVVTSQTEITFTSLAAFPEQHAGTRLALRKRTTGRHLQGNAERRPT